MRYEENKITLLSNIARNNVENNAILYSHGMGMIDSWDLWFLLAGKKLPPAKGTVDQKLTQISSAATTGVIKHEEIPITSRDTPYALQKLLEIYKNQFLDAIETMKSDEYRDEILQQVEAEKERKETLTLRKDQLQKHIDRLISDSTKLLRSKLEELNIPGEGATADTLLSEVCFVHVLRGLNCFELIHVLGNSLQARNIVLRHKEIQAEVTQLQNEVTELEQQKETYVRERKKEMMEKCRQLGLINGAHITDAELEDICRRYLMGEITATLSYRKKLENRLAQCEPEIVTLEKRVTSLQQQTQQHAVLQQKQLQSQQQQHQQVSPKPGTTAVAVQRKEKNFSRSRSQEWPDIPDVGKINENNPEMLAKKILETGRKIEACTKIPRKSPERISVSRRKSGCNASNSNGNAPNANSTAASENVHMSAHNHHQQQNKEDVPAPKVNFYEDRLKSIITSVLNEDTGAAPNSSVSQSGPQPQHSSSHPNRSSSSQSIETCSQSSSSTNSLGNNHCNNSNNNALASARGMPNQSMMHHSNNAHPKSRMSSPPRASPGINEGQKKKNQLSPDITLGPGASPAKVALRNHLVNVSPEQQQKAVRNLNFGGQEKSGNPKTISDLMNNEIESSLARSRNVTPMSTASPPVRAVYSPISRPNSNENIPEALELSTSGYSSSSRATVLVNNPKAPGMDDGMMNEGLAAGLKARIMSMAKSSAMNLENSSGTIHTNSSCGKDEVSGTNSIESTSILLNSPLVKEKKVREDLKGGVTTVEVVLGSSEGLEESDSDKNLDSNASVLRVVRKRVSDGNINVSN
jgi:H3 lysine-79-specific histone-lysine N-methyltransferase